MSLTSEPSVSDVTPRDKINEMRGERTGEVQ